MACRRPNLLFVSDMQQQKAAARLVLPAGQRRRKASQHALPRTKAHKPMTLPLEDSAPKDFDFIIGDWTVRHRRLNERLCGCTDWTEFSGRSSTRKTLGGFGNLEDNILEFPEGTFRAAAMRSYCKKTKTWSIWWLDGRNPTHLDTPVVGQFEGNTGLFYANDVFNAKPIKIRFTWSSVADEGPRWEQAFSADGGATWETNWTMQFVPAEGEA